MALGHVKQELPAELCEYLSRIILTLPAEPGSSNRWTTVLGTLNPPQTPSPKSSSRRCFMDSAPALTFTPFSILTFSNLP